LEGGREGSPFGSTRPLWDEAVIWQKEVKIFELYEKLFKISIHSAAKLNFLLYRNSNGKTFYMKPQKYFYRNPNRKTFI